MQFGNMRVAIDTNVWHLKNVKKNDVNQNYILKVDGKFTKVDDKFNLDHDIKK